MENVEVELKKKESGDYELCIKFFSSEHQYKYVSLVFNNESDFAEVSAQMNKLIKELK